MDNWKLYALAGFNHVYETLEKGLALSGILFNSACNYLNGTSNEWYFIKNGLTLPASSFHKRPSNSSLHWVYDVYQNSLVPGTYKYDGGERRLKWLSTTINIDATVYNMDDFIKQLVYVPSGNHVLDTNVLVTCYYIYSKRWPVSDRDVILNIVDSNGSEHTIVLDGTADEDDEWDELVNVEEEVEEEDAEEEEATEAVTEVVSEAVSEVVSEAVSEVVAEAVTEAVAEVASEAVAEVAATEVVATEVATPSPSDQENTAEIGPDNKIEPKQATEIVC
jgi:hypothetical protein